MNTKIVAFVLVIALMLSAGMASALSNSGGGDWKYYREVTIKENSGTALSDHQVLVELNPSNFPDKAKMDGSDLRFTEDGKEFSYWIEDYDAGARTARIWVKVPSIPANREAKIKMYYGNEKAGSVSNGEATFEFFDDFDENELKNCWDVKNAQYDLEDSKIKITITRDYGGLYGKLPKEYSRGGLTVGFKWCKCSSGWAPAFHPTDNPMYIEWGKWGHDDDNWVSYDGGGWNNVHVKRVNTNQYSVVHYIVDISRKLFKVEIDETSSDLVNCANGRDTSNFKKIDGLVFREGGFSRGTLGIDFVFVAKYTSPEPTISISTPTPTEGITISVDTVPKYKDTYVEGETITVAITVKENGVPRKDLVKDGFLIYEYSGKKVIGPYVNGKHLEDENFDDSESSKGIYKIEIEGGIPAGKHDKIYVCYGCNPREGQAQVYDFFSITVTPKEKGELEMSLECPSEVKPGSEFEMTLYIVNPTHNTNAVFTDYTIRTDSESITITESNSKYIKYEYDISDVPAMLVGNGLEVIPQAVRYGSTIFFTLSLDKKLKKEGEKGIIVIPPNSKFHTKLYAKAPSSALKAQISVELRYKYETYQQTGMQRWYEITYKSMRNTEMQAGTAYTEEEIWIREKQGIPGFEVIFGIASLLAVAYLLRRWK